MTEEEKLAVAIISLDNKALPWFQWEESHRSILSWDKLKAHLLDHSDTPKKVPFVSSSCLLSKMGQFGITYAPLSFWQQRWKACRSRCKRALSLMVSNQRCEPK